MAHTSIRQIQIFEQVARYQSHTRASEELHMTQPAVSMQMKQMEENLGVSLFDRRGKKLSLTKTGEEMSKHCSYIVQAYNDMIEYVDEVKGGKSGQLSVSVASTANTFATHILSAFSKRHPQVAISLDITNRRKILYQLDHFEPDLVIMGEPPKGLSLNSEKFMPNPLVVIAPPDHPLADSAQISPEVLAKERFVVREKGSGTREAIERHFAKLGQKCGGTLELSDNEAIKYAVAAGFGLGVVSLHTIQLELKNLLLVTLDVEGFPIERNWHLVTRSEKAMTPVARAFREFMLQEAKKYTKLVEQR
ncbi:MAG: LysR family transcriptional regulator [Pseudomonadota bacterium]